MGEPLEERREGRTNIAPECSEELESTDTCGERVVGYLLSQSAVQETLLKWKFGKRVGVPTVGGQHAFPDMVGKRRLCKTEPYTLTLHLA